MIKPLIGIISSAFGKRINPITKKEEFHGGIDIKTTTEDLTVLFPYSGKAIVISESTSFGKRIWVKINKVGHRLHGRYYVLAHLDSFDEGLYEGKSIKEGEKAGICGTTGMSTGVHLHFEIANCVHVDRTPIEPTEIIALYSEKPKENEAEKSENVEDLKDKKEPVKEKKTKKEPKEYRDWETDRKSVV